MEELLAKHAKQTEILGLKGENLLQSQIVYLLEKHNFTVFAVPNANKRGSREVAVHKAVGMKAGAPDLVVVGVGGAVWFVEVKFGKGKLSEHQLAMKEKLGERYLVWNCIERCMCFLQAHKPLLNPNTRETCVKQPTLKDNAFGGVLIYPED